MPRSYLFQCSFRKIVFSRMKPGQLHTDGHVYKIVIFFIFPSGSCYYYRIIFILLYLIFISSEFNSLCFGSKNLELSKQILFRFLTSGYMYHFNNFLCLVSYIPYMYHICLTAQQRKKKIIIIFFGSIRIWEQ